MDELDHAILEFFEALGRPGGEAVAQPPTAVWLNLAELRGVTEKQQNTVARHMGKLVDAGLLERIDEQRGYYKLTDLGFRYVRDELSDEEAADIRSRL